MKADSFAKRWRRKNVLPWPKKAYSPISESEYRSYRSVHPFDERYGVDTSGLVYDLPTGHENDAYNNGYFGVAPSLFHQIFERLQVDYRRFTFVDLGSGKGRALLLASSYPYQEVIGVELSPLLDRIARVNIAHYARSHEPGPPVRSIQADAAEFCWPPGPLLVYMWNAFTEPVMRRVLENLNSALTGQPREMYLVYVHPELEEMLYDLPWLERLWAAEIAMSDEDYSAWAFPTRSESCAVYRAILRTPAHSQLSPHSPYL
jgi:SAM-dependent methyltransferase